MGAENEEPGPLRIMEDGGRAFFARWGVMLSIQTCALLLAIAYDAWGSSIAAASVIDWVRSETMPSVTQIRGVILQLGISTLLYHFVFGTVAKAAVSHALLRARKGDAFRDVFIASFSETAVKSLLLGLLLGGVFFALTMGPWAVFLVAFAEEFQRALSSRDLASLLKMSSILMLSSCLMFGVATIVYVRTVFAPQLLVVERCGVIDSIRRSNALAKSRSTTIVVILTLLMAITALAATIATAFVPFPSITSLDPQMLKGALPALIRMQVWASVLQGVFGLGVGAYGSCAWALYCDRLASSSS